jgi:hypothetical protein
MDRASRYAPAALPSAEDETFQRPLDQAAPEALAAMVRALAGLARERATQG